MRKVVTEKASSHIQATCISSNYLQWLGLARTLAWNTIQVLYLGGKSLVPPAVAAASQNLHQKAKVRSWNWELNPGTGVFQKIISVIYFVFLVPSLFKRLLHASCE